MSSIVPLNDFRSSAAPNAHRHFVRVPAYLVDSERYIGRIVGIIMRTILFIFLVRFFIIEPGFTDGISMEPTLRDNTFFAVDKVSALFSPPKRYDIIQAFDPDDHSRFIIKRVIALPGETVIFSQNKVFIQDEYGIRLPIAEDYLSKNIINSIPNGGEPQVVVPTDSYFVLGDNRPNSRDSRYFGPIHRRLITGKIYPIALY